MATICAVCTSKINNQRKAVKCNEKVCLKLCHIDCLEEDSSPETWRCKDCSEPSLTDLMRELKNIKNMSKDVAKSIDICHEKIDENNALIRKQEKQIAECMTKIENLSSKCENLEKENSELKSKLNNQEQYTRLNSIEIVGIPEIKNENVLSTVAYVFKALNVRFELNGIDCCYRINSQQKSTEPRIIYLKFVSRLLMEEFLKAKRMRKSLCFGDIGLEVAGSVYDPKKPIYLNESLTKENRVLFAKCREYKNKHNIKFLWIKNGKILMRKSENAKVFVINSVNSFSDVH